MTAATTKRPSGSTKQARGARAKGRAMTDARHPIDALQLRPLGDRVVIQPSPREEMTRGGIVIPDTVKERPQEGTVLAVGPGRILDDGKRERLDMKKGDTVLYAKYAATDIKVGDDDLLIVSGKDILAIVLA